MHTEHNHIGTESMLAGEDSGAGDLLIENSPAAAQEILQRELAAELALAEALPGERKDENAPDAETELPPAFEALDSLAVIMETYGGTEADWVSTGSMFASGTFLINGEITGEPQGIDSTKGRDLLSQGDAEAIQQNQEMIQALTRDGYFAKDFNNGEGAFVAYLDESRQIVYENFERVKIEDEKPPETEEGELVGQEFTLDSGEPDEATADDELPLDVDEAAETPLIQISLTEAVRETVPVQDQTLDRESAQASTEVAESVTLPFKVDVAQPASEQVQEAVVSIVTEEQEVPAVTEVPVAEEAPVSSDRLPLSEPAPEFAAPPTQEAAFIKAESPVKAEIVEPTPAASAEKVYEASATPSVPELNKDAVPQEVVITAVQAEEIQPLAPSMKEVEAETPAVIAAEAVATPRLVDVAPPAPESSSAPLVSPEVVSRQIESKSEGFVVREVQDAVIDVATPPVEKTHNVQAEVSEPAEYAAQPEAVSSSTPNARVIEPRVITEPVVVSARTAEMPLAADTRTSNEPVPKNTEAATTVTNGERAAPVEVRATGRDLRSNENNQDAVIVEKAPLTEELDEAGRERNSDRPVTAETYAFLEEHGLPLPSLRVVQTAGIEAARARRGIASVIAGGMPVRRRPVVTLRDAVSGITLKRAA